MQQPQAQPDAGFRLVKWTCPQCGTAVHRPGYPAPECQRCMTLFERAVIMQKD